MRYILFLVLAAVLSMPVPSLADEKFPGKPGWWPDPDDSEWDLDWPPPRPKDWPEGQSWPPDRRTAADPGFWAELFGETPDAKTDKRLAENGDSGSWRFRYVFDQISIFDQNIRPGCGLHVLQRMELKGQKSCTPYPEKDVRALCGDAFDARLAKAQCSKNCARNLREKRCSEGWLTEPPVDVSWGCEELAFTSLGQRVVHHRAQCIAFYICDCMES